MAVSRVLGFFAAVALAGTFFLAPSVARAAEGEPDVKSGMLKCNVGSGWGFVFGSSKDLKCIYSPVEGATERYHGDIKKYGVDIGYSEHGVLIWTVFAPTANLQPGALKGLYLGASAEATAGAGIGANVLIGGGGSIALQPLSVSGQEGLNIAAGIGSISLDPAN